MAIIFSKLLSKTDIEKRLAVPTKHLKSFPSFPSFQDGHAVDFEATDERGHVWTFRCSVRKKKQYLKPVICKGWLAFVSSKKLKNGDQVKFYKETSEACGTYLRVEAEREIKLFGSVIGYSPIMYGM